MDETAETTETEAAGRRAGSEAKAGNGGLAVRATDDRRAAVRDTESLLASDPQRREGEADLSDSELYFNRELSWLDFNDRVLQLAEDGSVPLLERVKFCAIYEDNLDEFFMVRVAGLHDKIEAGIEAAAADGLTPRRQVELIRERALAMGTRLCRCFAHDLAPALAEHGIRVIAPADAGPEQREELDKVFREQIFPALTPLVIGMGRPFPYISNLSLSLLVRLRDPEHDADVMARVKVPKELLRRFVPVGDGQTFVPIEDVIAENLSALFPGMEIRDHTLFRVTRDTDYDISDEADDLRQAVEDEIRRRRFGEVVRLEVQAGTDPSLRELLVGSLEIEDSQLYEVDGLIGMDDLFDVAAVSGHLELRYPPFSPPTHPRLQGEDGAPADVMAAMRESDILVHHPYDAFESSVEAFITQAVEDPDVLAIKQTVYRTSADSPLVPSLIKASERGKQAVCMVELKARFDEQANIDWAKKLEQAGVHVVYGIPALKTHAKCVLVVRREGSGVRNYVHVGTGNYNPKTARLYTDFGLLTADPEIGADIAQMFNYLTGYAKPEAYRKALVAPYGLQPGIIEEIDKTVAAHKAGEHARIRMKMNALLDARSIRALYEASIAGVEIELNVRGICALRPGVPGVSERITVVSVLGRFLEHSRIFSFERGSEVTILTGSADLMPRNLYNRVELLVPVSDERARAQLTDVLDRSLAERVGAWELQASGDWVRRERDSDDQHLQTELIALHQARASEASGAAAPV